MSFLAKVGLILHPRIDETKNKGSDPLLSHKLLSFYFALYIGD